MLDKSLGVNKEDMVLIGSDPDRQELVHSISAALERRGIKYTALCVDYDGKHVPAELSERMLDDCHNVLLLFFGKSVWHQPERRKAKYDKRKRVVSYAGTLEMLEDGPALADPEKIKIICDDLRPHIGNGTHISLEGPDGTSISADCLSVGFEEGVYRNPGEGGNFPCGEAYAFGLIEETINGYVRSNVKVKHLGLSMPGNDAIFYVKEGRLYPAETEAAMFFSLIERDAELGFVAELAFGICPYDRVFSYPNSAQEEKILGLAHVGLGSSISFGGTRKGKHMDLMFGPATVKIDDKSVIIEGKMNPEYLSPRSRQWIGERGFLYTP
ncbi:MAG: hypothetical protein HY517_01895 [Candidatus Aenigmarchaeota archaeon]|nr:hypothetical protein [Candidatus Aenigmarchaeota archaeon]